MVYKEHILPELKADEFEIRIVFNKNKHRKDINYLMKKLIKYRINCISFNMFTG